MPPCETRGGAVFLGLLEEWSGLFKRCADTGASTGRCREDARLGASLARPRLVVASYVAKNPGVDGTLTVVLEGDTSDPSTVRSEVMELMATVWALLDADVREHRKTHNRAFHRWVDEQFRGGAGGLHRLLEPAPSGLEQLVFAKDGAHVAETADGSIFAGVSRPVAGTPSPSPPRSVVAEVGALARALCSRRFPEWALAQGQAP